MLEFRHVPLKKPYDVDVVKPLKNVLRIINSTSTKSQDFTNQINEFSKLRSSALWKAYERNDGALVELYTYYDQLNALEKKIPAGELQVPFKWQDAFCKGAFLTKTKLTISNIEYEKTCVLFNIAALQSYIGSQKTIDDDQGLKLAAKLFQLCAGIYDHLKTNVMTIIQREPTPDLHPDTLAALSSLMMAQAQEIFVHKSRREKMKNELIAIISNETSNMYSDALKNIKNPCINYLWDRETFPILSGKQAMFRGMGEFYQSLECKTNNAIGEHIARLKISIEHLKTALKHSNKLATATEHITIAEQLLSDAIRENEFIFLDKVPDINSLRPVGRKVLARPQPIPQRFSNEFIDLFAGILPISVQTKLILFETRKQEFVQTEVFKIREATQILNGILASLNLPAAIEDSVEREIPPSLVNKSTTVQNHGGLTTINRMLDRLPDLHNRNAEILEEIEKMLNNEEESDDKLRRRFKEKWTRKNSSRLTSSFRTNLEKYRRAINIAIKADKSVRNKFEEHKINMELLSNGPEVISNSIPQATLKSFNKDSQCVNRLKCLMVQVETIKLERDAIESELKSTNEDINETIMSAMNKENLKEEAIVDEAMDRICKPTQQKVKESLTNQENVVKDIQKANAEFLIERKELDIAVREREDVFKKLATAYDAFIELSNNLEEGTKFYNNLTEVLLMFQSKVSDFCFARNTEKEELLKDLEKDTKPETRDSTPKMENDNILLTDSKNKPQDYIGPTATCSVIPELPYPTFPQNMPMPYGSYIQPPYLQYYIPPLPSIYYTMPFPPGSQTQLQNTPDLPQKENKPPS